METKGKILVTGAKGFVGARVMEYFKDAVAFPSEILRDKNPEKGVMEFVKRIQPAAIIHTAAISDIGECEKDPDASYLANVILPDALNKAALEEKIKILLFSSDQVYTGMTEEGPYSDETELPEPTNTYARHKLLSEKRTLDKNPDCVHLRATWMYDMPLYNHKNRMNFLTLALKAAKTGAPMDASENQYRAVTYVRQVASNLEKMLSAPGGAYNYGSANNLNMYETTLAFFKSLGLADKAETLTRKTHTPGNLWMTFEKLNKAGVYFDTTAEGFERVIRDYALKV
ncbi:MAG: sugar nucleotide-binding protein [Clostridia bacterium]|nr:sugar nucleotide-binding protein [Clostridia bacterium]